MSRRTKKDIAALRADAQQQAEVVLLEGVRAGHGLLHLVAALSTAYQTGVELGLALGVHHPGLARQLLDAIDAEVYAKHGHEVIQEVGEARAGYLAWWVEVMNS